MTSRETILLRKVVVSVITHRAGSGADATAVAAAARRAYDELAEVLGPLIGQAGVEALLGRAVHLARREYESDQAGEQQAGEPFGQVSLWLARQDPPIATAAAAGVFVTFAELLATLIGEPLTTRYLKKAWPDGFSDTDPKGTRA